MAATASGTKVPLRRLQDVLKPRTAAAAAKDALDCARVQTTLPADALRATLAGQNRLLVSFRDFHAFGAFPGFGAAAAAPAFRFRNQPLWAFYKPPFAPMRQLSPGASSSPPSPSSSSEAPPSNFHNVSVERFVTRVLAQTAGSALGAGSGGAAPHVSVLYDLHADWSGVVVALVAPGGAPSAGLTDAPHAARAHAELDFEMLCHGDARAVAGAVSRASGGGRGGGSGGAAAATASGDVPLGLLYPRLQSGDSAWTIRPSLTVAAAAAAKGGADGGAPEPTARFTVAASGYYGGLPVSLVRCRLCGPPSAAAPALRALASVVLSTRIVGDERDGAGLPPDARAAVDAAFARRPALAGDAAAALDFPRVMVHLRRAAFYDDVFEPQTKGGAASFGGVGADGRPLPPDAPLLRRAKVAEFVCAPCLAPLVRPDPGPPKGGIRLGDGYWHPRM